MLAATWRVIFSRHTMPWIPAIIFVCVWPLLYFFTSFAFTCWICLPVFLFAGLRFISACFLLTFSDFDLFAHIKPVYGFSSGVSLHLTYLCWKSVPILKAPLNSLVCLIWSNVSTSFQSETYMLTIYTHTLSLSLRFWTANCSLRLISRWTMTRFLPSQPY